MVLESSDEHLAVRFSPYVAEFHELFAARGMHFGSPEDIFGLAGQLFAAGTFRDEMTSLIRAVVHRENTNLTQGDLLGLLTIAIGGPAIDLTEPRFRAPVRQILLFLTGVLRTLWHKSTGQATHPEPAVAPQVRSIKPAAPADHATRVKPPTRFVEEVQVRPDTTESESFGSESDIGTRPAAKEGVFSRIRSLWRDPDAAALPEVDGSYPEYQPVGLFKAKYRPFWLVGLCGVSLGLAAGLMLRNRPALPKPVPQSSVAESFHPWFPPIPKPHQGDAFQADAAPLPSLPVPNPNLSQLPAGAGAVAAEQSSASTSPASDDEALERKFFSGNRKPPQNSGELAAPSPGPISSQFPRQYNIPMTGQSHPLAGPGASSAATRAHAGSLYAQLAAPPSPERGRYAFPRAAQPVRIIPTTALPHASVYLSASGAMAGNLVSAPAPEYPRLASSSHVQGKVVVQAVVGTDGSVIASRVLSGPQFLRSASLNAVRRWRYRPYTVDGRATVVATNAILNFQLAP